MAKKEKVPSHLDTIQEMQTELRLYTVGSWAEAPGGCPETNLVYGLRRDTKLYLIGWLDQLEERNINSIDSKDFLQIYNHLEFTDQVYIRFCIPDEDFVDEGTNPGPGYASFFIYRESSGNFLTFKQTLWLQEMMVRNSFFDRDVSTRSVETNEIATRAIRMLIAIADVTIASNRER